MNLCCLKYLNTLSIKVIIIVFAFLVLSGTGVYFYTHQETKLTFHPDWTETDRRQMHEIVNFMNEKREEKEKQASEEFRDLFTDFSLDEWDSWSRLCKGAYYYGRSWLKQEEFEDFGSVDIVTKTARTGNALYIGKGELTLLTLACGLGKRELACHLMDKGTDVNIRTIVEEETGRRYGDAPINWLACGGMDFSRPIDVDTVISLMEKLASHGADLNVKVRDIISPFEMLCGFGTGSSYSKEDKERMIFKLIDLGADVSSPVGFNGKKRSSFLFPVLFGQDKVVRLLCERGVDTNEGYDALPPLFFVDPTKRPEDQLKSARTLLDYGAQINAALLARNTDERGKIGQTPLAYLCASAGVLDVSDEKQKQCFLDLVSLYFERKANVNQASADGVTPLMFLFDGIDTQKNPELRVELARRLLKQGADPSLKNHKGQTVLDMIRMYPNQGKKILDSLPELQSAN